MKIKYKLFFISCLPMMFALIIAGFNIKQIWQTKSQIDELLPVVKIVGKANDLLYELQKERGRTAGLIASNGKNAMKEQLKIQRLKTDNQLLLFKKFVNEFQLDSYNNEFKKIVLICMEKLENLNSTRMKIENFPLIKALDYFTNKIEEPLIKLSVCLSKISSDTEISTTATAYYSILLYKVNIGLERAIMNAVFIKDKFPPGFYKKFVSLVSSQRVHESNFLSMAGEEEKKLFFKKMKSRYVDEVSKIRAIIHENYKIGDFNVSPNHWFDMITGKNDLLKKVEIKIANHLVKRSVKLRDEAQKNLNYYLTLIFIFTAILFILLYKTIVSITRPVKELSIIAKKVSTGDMSMKSSINAKGEIGLLANVFNEMIDNISKRIISEEEKKIKLTNTMEKINFDLEMAKRLQRELLPRNFNDFPEVNIQSRFIPYTKVGGDLYDFWRLSKSKICFLIFDVAGHGVAAALLTTVSKQSFRKNISSDFSIEECMKKVNKELASFFSDHQFLTAIVTILDIEKKELTICQCGHPPFYLHKKSSKELLELKDYNCAIGPFEDWNFVSTTFNIKSGDRFYLYTDGLVETKNLKKENYEQERLKKIILSSEASFDKKAELIISDIDNFRENSDQADDLTLMCVEIL